MEELKRMSTIMRVKNVFEGRSDWYLQNAARYRLCDFNTLSGGIITQT